MRTLALCLVLLAGCGGNDPAPTPDASPDTATADIVSQPDAPPPPDSPTMPDAAKIDATPDVIPDAPAADALSEDRAPADASTDAADGGFVSCGPQRAYCEPVTMPGVCVLLNIGVRRSDGRIVHCGACGVVCGEGEVCAGTCGR